MCIVCVLTTILRKTSQEEFEQCLPPSDCITDGREQASFLGHGELSVPFLELDQPLMWPLHVQ